MENKSISRINYNPFAIINEQLQSINQALLELKARPVAPIQEQPSEYVTKKEAAKLIGCSVSTIDHKRRAGELSRYNVGSAVKFKRTDVLALVKKVRI